MPKFGNLGKLNCM